MPRAGLRRAALLLRFLDTAGGAGFVTVIVGGLCGQLIAGRIEDGEKEREFQRAWLATRGEQALSAHKRYVEDGLDLIQRGYERLGGMISSADNLVLLTEPGWQLTGHHGLDSVFLADQRRGLRARFNDQAAVWDTTHKALGLMLDYYFGAHNDDITNSWRRVDVAVADYNDAVIAGYRAYLRHDSLSVSLISSARMRALAAVDSLGVCVRQKREYLWEGWDSPEALRAKLGVK
jgi:hypothetical protein